MIYEEELFSKKTTALFIGLMLFPLFLFVWKMIVDGFQFSTIILLFISLLFFFYVLNYRKLFIQVTSNELTLRFGLFIWKEPLSNIETCIHDDDLPMLYKYSGAGIHFYFYKKKYRISFNFLEHPRVLILLKKKRGLVRAISFSTRKTDKIIQFIRQEKHKRSNT